MDTYPLYSSSFPILWNIKKLTFNFFKEKETYVKSRGETALYYEYKCKTSSYEECIGPPYVSEW